MLNIATEAEHLLPIIWDPANGYFVSVTYSKPIFLGLFILLEILQVIWLMYSLNQLFISNILKLIYRQLFKGVMLGDDRSCKDESDEEYLCLIKQMYIKDNYPQYLSSVVLYRGFTICVPDPG